MMKWPNGSASPTCMALFPRIIQISKFCLALPEGGAHQSGWRRSHEREDVIQVTGHAQDKPCLLCSETTQDLSGLHLPRGKPGGANRVWIRSRYKTFSASQKALLLISRELLGPIHWTFNIHAPSVCVCVCTCVHTRVYLVHLKELAPNQWYQTVNQQTHLADQHGQPLSACGGGYMAPAPKALHMEGIALAHSFNRYL